MPSPSKKTQKDLFVKETDVQAALAAHSAKNIDRELLLEFANKLKNKEIESLWQLNRDIGDEKFKALFVTTLQIPNLDGLVLINLPTLLKGKPELYDSLPNSLKIREIGHRLGLEGGAFEPTVTGLAAVSRQLNFNKSSHRKENRFSNFECRTITEDDVTAASILENTTHHGDMESILARWSGHTFSFHVVREGDKTHIIYVNRGESHDPNDLNPKPVYVFTLDDQGISERTINGLIQALKTQNQKIISRYITRNLMRYHNPGASKILAKSNQKVNNCTFANANISWHFKLASDLMKKNPSLSFTAAYQQTTAAYKAMRMNDRADAFCSLVKSPQLFENQADYKNALKQAMAKMFKKDLKNPERQIISFLLNQLENKDPDELKKLYDLINNDALFKEDKRFDKIKLKWSQEIYKILPESLQQQIDLEHQTNMDSAQHSAHQKEPEPAHQNESEPAHQKEPEPAHQNESEPAHQKEPESAHQREPDPAHQSESEPAHQRKLEPAHQNEQPPASTSTSKSDYNIYASLEPVDVAKLMASLTNTRVAINFTIAELKLTSQHIEKFKKEGLMVHSPSGHQYHLKEVNGKYQALLTEAQAKKQGNEPHEQYQIRLGVTVINMIDNALAKNENISIKTKDPFVAEIARLYLDSLQQAGKIEHNSYQISGSKESKGEEKLANDVFQKLNIKGEAINQNPAIKAREEMMRLRIQDKGPSNEPSNIAPELG